MARSSELQGRTIVNECRRHPFRAFQRDEDRRQLRGDLEDSGVETAGEPTLPATYGTCVFRYPCRLSPKRRLDRPTLRGKLQTRLCRRAHVREPSRSTRRSQLLTLVRALTAPDHTRTEDQPRARTSPPRTSTRGGRGRARRCSGSSAAGALAADEEQRVVTPQDRQADTRDVRRRGAEVTELRARLRR